jgi:hypothetical protein
MSSAPANPSSSHWLLLRNQLQARPHVDHMLSSVGLSERHSALMRDGSHAISHRSTRCVLCHARVLTHAITFLTHHSYVATYDRRRPTMCSTCADRADAGLMDRRGAAERFDGSTQRGVSSSAVGRSSDHARTASPSESRPLVSSPRWCPCVLVGMHDVRG